MEEKISIDISANSEDESSFLSAPATIPNDFDFFMSCNNRERIYHPEGAFLPLQKFYDFYFKKLEVYSFNRVKKIAVNDSLNAYRRIIRDVHKSDYGLTEIISDTRTHMLTKTFLTLKQSTNNPKLEFFFINRQ